MNEEIQTNNQPEIQPEGDKNKNHIPTAIGFAIAFAVIISFLLLFFKFREASAPVQNPSDAKTVSQEKKSTAPESSKVEISQDAKGNVDMDAELKKLDTSVNSASESDFNSADFSDSSMGL